MAHFAVLVLLEREQASLLSAEAIEQEAERRLEPYRYVLDEHDQWRGEYDYCVLGGLFTEDVTTDYDPATDPANWEVCPLCWGTGQTSMAGSDKFCPSCQGVGTRAKVLKIAPEILSVAAMNPEFVPYAVVTPEGHWLEMGYTLDRAGLRQETYWQIRAKYLGHVAVLFDCHS